MYGSQIIYINLSSNQLILSISIFFLHLEFYQTFDDLYDTKSLEKMKHYIFGKSFLLTKSLKSVQQSASRLLTTSGNGNYSATLGIKEDGKSKSDM